MNSKQDEKIRYYIRTIKFKCYSIGKRVHVYLKTYSRKGFHHLKLINNINRGIIAFKPYKYIRITEC